MTQRDVVFPPGRQALYERNRYSPAVRANGMLFVSGQVGSREDGSPEPELEAQVRRAFANLNAVLTRFNNSGTGQAAPGGNGYLGGVTGVAGQDSTSIALGVRHTF